MAWEMFLPTNTKSNIRASIANTGSISFTQGVEQKFKLDRNHDKFANIYYDNITQKIGIQFVATKGPATIKTHFRKEGGFWFSGKPFLLHFDLLPEKTHLYEIAEENGMLVVKLNTARERKNKKIATE